MDVDYERIAMLLAVIEACAGHNGKLNGISSAAASELAAINEELRQNSTGTKQKTNSVDEVDEVEETKSARRI